MLTCVMIGSTFILSAQTKITSSEIVDRIKREVGLQWSDHTVDDYKGGNGAIQITGVATTFMATLDVLKKAKAQGLNMVITHEPTFYNHFDKLDQYGGDDIVSMKKTFIEDNNMVIWRFHDYWHQMQPDGIYMGVTSLLGWEKYEESKAPYLFTLPELTISELANDLKKKFNANSVRVVGDPDMKVSKVSLVLGAPGAAAQIESLQRDDVEVMIGGETHEWETVEYVRDAMSLGKRKGLVLLGHVHSEEAGMIYCAEWLKGFISEVPIHFIAAGEPFWIPGD